MKTLPKKLLAVSLCAAVSLIGAPVTTFSEGGPDKFIDAANANHWGRSDLREYLNGVEKKDNTLECDTTHDTRQTSDYYESQFSNAEYALVQPFTYNTTTLKADGTSDAPHSATDRFWLPSGAAGGFVLSWGADDLSGSPPLDFSRVIPVSYWSYAEGGTWLRSPFYNADDGPQARIASRGGAVDAYIISEPSPFAAAFKLDVSTVGFASSASAASLAAEGADSGSKTVGILSSEHFGSKTSEPLPDYGMYLKTTSTDNFEATGLSYSGTQLTVNYTGGAENQFVVVQAFKADNLEANTTFYAAAQKLEADNVGDNKSIELDVSSWVLSSLADYTIKVWMEDASGGSSLAAATTPATFVGTSSLINQVADGSGAKNQRVFADVQDLQTSWGDLSGLSPDDQENVKGGSPVEGSYGVDPFVRGKVAGVGATNQKIYFGTKAGAPLEFWVAGRETAANDGSISSTGNIMTLYQAKSVESQRFNSSTDAYKNVPTLTLKSGASVPYSSSPQGPGVDSYTFNGSSLGTPTITWYYRVKDSGTEFASETSPEDVGVYEIYGVAVGSGEYETVTSEQVTFTITKAMPTVSNPEAISNLAYTGSDQALVSAGLATGGEMQYALGENSSTEPTSGWSTDIPTGKDADTYYVWYRVVGDANHNDSAAACVEVTIGKATPDASELKPSLTATYGQTLGDIRNSLASTIGSFLGVDDNELDGLWTWEAGDETKVGSLGNQTHTAVFTPSDKNYSTANVDVTVNVAQATPDDSKLNPSLTATYGQALDDIRKGLATTIGSFLDVDGDALEGEWLWSDDATTKVGNVGTNTFTALFAPTDTINYDWTTLDGWNDTLRELAVDVAVDVAQATPDDSKLTPSPSLEATYGQTLGDIKAGLASAIGSFLGVDDKELDGNWAWEKDDATKVGNVGEDKFTAIFTPTNGNYAKTTIDVTVKVSVETSKWGEAQKRDADGKTQYVESSGKTSIELTQNNLSDGGILWLREESYDTSAWYGIDLSSGAFDLDKGLRLYVRWLNPNDADYAEIYAQLDDAQKARVEADNGWIFLIGIEDPDGNKVQPVQPVKVFVQLGDPNEGADWDLEHLKAYYITSGGDENVPVEDVLNFPYPGNEDGDEFGMMTLSHFSPYFIFDELTDEEKAALTPTPNDNNNQPTDKPNSSGTDLPGTGDISTELLISGLAIVLVSSLGVMLRLITNKKKFEE